jgi:hypothetical protein
MVSFQNKTTHKVNTMKTTQEQTLLALPIKLTVDKLSTVEQLKRWARQAPATIDSNEDTLPYMRDAYRLCKLAGPGRYGKNYFVWDLFGKKVKFTKTEEGFTMEVVDRATFAMTSKAHAEEIRRQMAAIKAHD